MSLFLWCLEIMGIFLSNLIFKYLFFSFSVGKTDFLSFFLSFWIFFISVWVQVGTWLGKFRLDSSLNLFKWLIVSCSTFLLTVMNEMMVGISMYSCIDLTGSVRAAATPAVTESNRKTRRVWAGGQGLRVGSRGTGKAWGGCGVGAGAPFAQHSGGRSRSSPGRSARARGR